VPWMTRQMNKQIAAITTAATTNHVRRLAISLTDKLRFMVI